MKKVSGALIVVSFLLCAFTAQAASSVDAPGIMSAPQAATPVFCSSDADCGDLQACLTEAICMPEEPDAMVFGVPSAALYATCTTDEDCDIGSVCEEVSICVDIGECASDEDCIGNPNGERCNTETGTCVECVTDEDCGDLEWCYDTTGQCRPILNCELKTRPLKVKVSGKRKTYVTAGLKVKGNENFDPSIFNSKSENYDPNAVVNELDLGPFTAGRIRARKHFMKIQLIVPTDTEPGIYELRFLNCFSEIEIK